MKRLLNIALLAACQNLLAQTWETIFPSSTYAPGTGSVGGLSLLMDPLPSPDSSRRLYVGTIDHSGNPSVLRTTVNEPGSPDVLLGVEGVDGEPDGLTTTRLLTHIPGEGIYAIGRFTIRTRNDTRYFWKVRCSPTVDPLQAGSYWTTQDTFVYNSKSWGSAACGVAFDAARNAVLVSGWAHDGRDYRWIVRRKPVGAPASQWTNVLNVVTFNTVEASICYFPGNANNPRPALLTTGRVQSGKTNPKWAVRRSLDGGFTWNEVHTWSPSASEATPTDIVCHPVTGDIYAVGGIWASTDFGFPSGGWVVRVNRFGGEPAKWETLLESHSPGGTAYRTAFGPEGSVWIAGTTDSTAASRVLTVLRNTPGQSWSDSWATPMFPFEGFSSEVGRPAITADSDGTVYVTSGVKDWADEANIYPGNRAALARLLMP